jgi:hypothetical protein
MLAGIAEFERELIRVDILVKEPWRRVTRAFTKASSKSELYVPTPRSSNANGLCGRVCFIVYAGLILPTASTK